MRHRPGLCVSGRRREARPPLLTERFSACRRGETIKQTSRNPPYGGYQLDVVDRPVSSAAPQRMSRSDTSTSVEAERGQRCESARRRRRRSSGPGRGRARAPRGAPRAGAPASRSSMARRRCDRRAGGPRRRAASAPRSMPADWVAVPATATAAVDAARARARAPPRRARGRPRRPSASQLRRASGGSECRWRSEWRTTPTWVETWKATSPRLADHELGRAAADVDHEQPLAGGRVARGGRAEEGQPRLLVAAQRAGVEPVALAHRASRTSAPLAASRTAEVITAVVALGAVLRDRRRRTPRARRTRARCGASPSAPVASTPSPSRVTIERRSTSVHGRRRSTSAISSRVEFVPMSTTATRVSWPGAASARRPARRAGCRRRSRSSCGASARSPSRRAGRRAGSARCSSGWSAGSGSGSVTSSAAPAIARSCSARSSAAGSTIGPRAVLTSSAVGFMRVERGLVDQVARVGRERAVERDEVRALEQLLERHAAGARRCGAPPSRSPRRAARPPGRCGRSRRSRASRRSPRRRGCGRARTSPTGPRARRARPRAAAARARAAARTRGRRSRR